MVLLDRHRWLTLAIVILCITGCAAPPRDAGPQTAPPAPTPTEACRYARQVTEILNDLSEIVRTGEGAGDVTGATHIQIFVGKAESKLGNAPAQAQLRWDAMATLRAADDLATAWVLHKAGREEQAAYDQALAKARRTAYEACR